MGKFARESHGENKKKNMYRIVPARRTHVRRRKRREIDWRRLYGQEGPLGLSP